MTDTTETAGTVLVKVHIMEKEYQIKCGPNEKHQLMKAAADVEARMRAAKNIGPTVTLEKAAVLTALNLANELQDTTDNSDMLITVSDTIVDMQTRIEKVLEGKKSIPQTEELTSIQS